TLITGSRTTRRCARGGLLSSGRRRRVCLSSGRMAQRCEIPDAGGILDQIHALPFERQRIHLNLFVQQRHQLHRDLQRLRLNEWSTGAETQVVSDDCILYAKAWRKEVEMHVPQGDPASQTSFEFRLDGSAIAVNVECGHENQDSHYDEDQKDPDADERLTHKLLLKCRASWIRSWMARVATGLDTENHREYGDAIATDRREQGPSAGVRSYAIPMIENLFVVMCALALSTLSGAQTVPSNTRPRVADLGLKVGALPAGQLDAITDVAGVEVGHTTIVRGD